MALKIYIFLILALLVEVAFGQNTLYLSIIPKERPDSASTIAIDHGEISCILLQPETGILNFSKTKKSQTTLYTYNPQSKDTSVLFTQEGDITSLQLFPDGKHLSFLTVNETGRKALVRLSIDGKNYRAVRNDLLWESFTWMDDNSLLFVAPGQPNTLNLMTMRPVKQFPIAKNVGTTLARSANPLSLYFVHKLSVDTWSLKQVGPDGNIHIITDTLPEADLFHVDGKKIYLESEGIIFKLEKDRWVEVTREFEGKKIVSFQVSNSGNKIAVLASGN